MKTLLATGGAAALSLAAAGSVSAAVDVVNFDGLNGGAFEQVLNYYNGGFGGLGTGPGPNFGVVFSSNAIVGCEQGTPCADTNAANAPSAPNVMFFLSGPAATMNVAAGFTTGFSFDYALQVGTQGFVSVFDGLNGTGNLLASFVLNPTPNPYTVFVPIGVSFNGTAESVEFGGVANFVAFDDVTFGSARVGGAPEPATWALMLMGVAGIGGAARASRRKVSAVA
jgi:hypothetical protein